MSYKHSTAEDSDRTLNYILDIIEEGIWDWNANTGHVNRSPGWYRMLGYDVNSFKENVITWENIIYPEDYDRVMAHFELYTKGKIDSYCVEYRCRRSYGDYIWIVDRGKIVEYNPDGTPARMIGAHRNIHEEKTARMELIQNNKLLQEGNLSLETLIRQKTEELRIRNLEMEDKIREVEYISSIDPLTCIANRKKFEEELRKEILRSNRYGHPLSLVIFDLDNFKQVNDMHGHRAGDTMLQHISRLVSGKIRESDFFARWGGEEFVIIFPNLTMEKAVPVVEKLRKLIARNRDDNNLSITCSFGISQYYSGDAIEELFRRADEALYRAKEMGRNRVEFRPAL